MSFCLDDVDLAPSVITAKQDRILSYASAYPATRSCQLPGVPQAWTPGAGNRPAAETTPIGNLSSHLLSMLTQA